MWIARQILSVVHTQACEFKVVAMVGPRQSGKTTLARDCCTHQRVQAVGRADAPATGPETGQARPEHAFASESVAPIP